jgi:DNA-binding NtrC family response regulator
MSARILVVDDESILRNSLARVLRGNGYSVRVAGCAEAALGEVRKEAPDLVLLDVCLPDTSGLEVLAQLKQINEHVVVIAMTAYESAKDAILAMKRGAYDYLSKPFNLEAIKLLVKRALESAQAPNSGEEPAGAPCQRHCAQCPCPWRGRPAARLCGDPWQGSACDRMIGTSPAMCNVLDIIHRLPANSGSNVLIEGETGTGKELAARAVHELSGRAAEPFFAICCGSIPRELMESELFGYEGGAYTGARPEGKLGVFEAAGGGTLFLDEIGELDPKLQVKLLRVLEAREFTRVGGLKRIRLRARLVAATNRQLKREVDEGRFRADLYYRLNVVRITLPPLRARRNDIISLAETFLREYDALFGKHFETISAPARRLMENYAWPGNIRELRNTIERIVLLETGDTMFPHHLPQEILNSAPPATCLPVDGESSGGKLLDVQRECIVKALARAGGNVASAARLLGLRRGALRYRMDKYAIPKDEFVPSPQID